MIAFRDGNFWIAACFAHCRRRYFTYGSYDDLMDVWCIASTPQKKTHKRREPSVGFRRLGH